jgi:hypothetical protein
MATMTESSTDKRVDDLRFDSLQRMMIVFFATTLPSIIASVIAGVILHF